MTEHVKNAYTLGRFVGAIDGHVQSLSPVLIANIGRNLDAWAAMLAFLMPHAVQHPNVAAILEHIAVPMPKFEAHSGSRTHIASASSTRGLAARGLGDRGSGRDVRTSRNFNLPPMAARRQTSAQQKCRPEPPTRSAGPRRRGAALASDVKPVRRSRYAWRLSLPANQIRTRLPADPWTQRVPRGPHRSDGVIRGEEESCFDPRLLEPTELPQVDGPGEQEQLVLVDPGFAALEQQVSRLQEVL